MWWQVGKKEATLARKPHQNSYPFYQLSLHELLEKISCNNTTSGFSMNCLDVARIFFIIGVFSSHVAPFYSLVSKE